MRKYFMFAAFAACAFGMNAQFTILKSGNVRIGAVNPTSTLSRAAGQSVTATETDSLASLNLLRGTNAGAGAYITFGDRKNVAIGEFYATKDIEDSNILGLYGSNGLKYITGTKEVFHYTAPGSATMSAPFTFNCNVKGLSFLTSSDEGMKRDVEEISGLSSLLSEVSPISYRLAEASEATKASAADEYQVLPLSPDTRLRYGFMAQEVKDILPDLVVEDETGSISIDYLGFIPILVDAYKTLETRVQEQEEIIARLSGSNARKAPTPGLDDILAEGKAVLLQNRPNPFRENTMIECVVPDGAAEAFICVYDLQGTQVNRLDVEERGNCSVTVDGSTLKPGMYVYALIVDGAEIDTKKMILTD